MKKVTIIMCIVLISLFLTSCASGDQRNYLGEARDSYKNYEIMRWHDKDYNITCWIYDGINGGGLYCIPDDQIHSIR